VPQFEVWAFGSRAKCGRGAAKPYSDLDLAVITDQPLPLKTSANLSDVPGVNYPDRWKRGMFG
jgi:predicted nucleotidyltransferase